MHSSPAALVQECTAGAGGRDSGRVQGVVTGESGELFHPDFLNPQSWRRQRAQEATADEPVFPLFCHREPANRRQQSRPLLTLQEQLGMSVVLGLASRLSPSPEPVATSQHSFAHAYKRACIHVYIHTYTFTHACMHAYHTYIHSYFRARANTRTDRRTDARAHTHTHEREDAIYNYESMHTHRPTPTHAHTHTHTHRPRRSTTNRCLRRSLV